MSKLLADEVLGHSARILLEEYLDRKAATSARRLRPGDLPNTPIGVGARNFMDWFRNHCGVETIQNRLETYSVTVSIL